MTGKRRTSMDAELRRRLRAGDPARDGSDLTPEETSYMRRSVLREAERGRATGPIVALRSALALASIVVVIAIGWLVFHDDEVTTPRTDEVALIPEAVVPPTPSPPAETHDEVVEQVTTLQEAPLDQPPAVATAGRPSRQVQFTTSNGTQIIWILDPEFKS